MTSWGLLFAWAPPGLPLIEAWGDAGGLEALAGHSRSHSLPNALLGPS